MEKHFYINITDQDGTLIDRFVIDGMDLRDTRHCIDLGVRVAEGMGGDNVAACADLPDVADL